MEKVVDGQAMLTEDSFERPVLIIDNRAFLIFKITSRMDREGYVIQDLDVAGLPKPSVVRTDALVPIHVEDLKYRMGKLSQRDVDGFLQYTANRPPLA